LRTALDQGGDAGLLLGASGNQIVLDGVPLGAAAAEKSFAQLLTTSGIASIHFSPNTTQGQFARFVRAFPSGNAKPSSLAEQLKTALLEQRRSGRKLGRVLADLGMVTESALNEFLAVAPRAEPVCGKVAAMVTIDDVSARPARTATRRSSTASGSVSSGWTPPIRRKSGFLNKLFGPPPVATSILSRTTIKPASRFDKLAQRIGRRFIFGGIAQNSRPFTDHSPVDRFRSGGSNDHGGERLYCVWDR
jgi:hypothetical protein